LYKRSHSRFKTSEGSSNIHNYYCRLNFEHKHSASKCGRTSGSKKSV
jgi:hypothetical protein